MISLFFYIFISTLLLSTLMAVIVQNTIYSVLFLILSFISTSFILFLFQCEFLALFFILIYVGAIAVLFLFSVMMLDFKLTKYNPIKYSPFGSFIGSIFLIEFFFLICKNFKTPQYNDNFLYNNYLNWYSKPDSIIDIQVISQILYNNYAGQLLLIGLILFLAIIGVILLSINYK